MLLKLHHFLYKCYIYTKLLLLHSPAAPSAALFHPLLPFVGQRLNRSNE